jgi:hypothetical protein
MATKAELEQINKDVKEHIEEYRHRVAEIRQPSSYPIDYPCYYCDANDYKTETGINKCYYCIHNTDNKLLELTT